MPLHSRLPAGRGVPGQHPALQRPGGQVDPDPEQAGHHDQGVHRGHGAAGLGDGDLLAQPRAADDQLGGDGQHQRDRGGQPEAGDGVGQGGGPDHVADAGPAAEPVAVGGVHGHRVDVLGAGQDLDEDLPERGVHDQQQLGAQVGAEQQHRQRDQGHRGDGAQELDGRGGGRPQGGDAADQQAEPDPGGHGHGQPDGPALQAVTQRPPEGRLPELVGQGAGDPAGRGQVALGHQAGPRHHLQQHQEATQPGHAQPPPLPAAGPHGSRAARSGCLVTRPSWTARVASVSTDARLISAVHSGRVSSLMTASSIWV
jgi:hypothetical protein